MQLIGRDAETGVLEEFLGRVRAGESHAFALVGESGAGKTALLQHIAERASGCLAVRVEGVQPEADLAFAGLYQLLTQLPVRFDQLPAAHREALRTAAGMRPGSLNWLAISLAVRHILFAASDKQSLICLVDDEQWLDHASVHVLAFTARRLGTRPVGLVFASREPSSEIAGLPFLKLNGLTDSAARTLLDSALAAPVDPAVRDRIIADAHGNPLAILDIPDELLGGFALPLATKDEWHLETLPDETRRLMQVAAADFVGDPVLVWRAADKLGIAARAANPAIEAGLLELDTHVRFRHPAVRRAAYWSATLPQRQEIHQALGDVTDQRTDPDRRAWHHAHATPGPQEAIAAELERCTVRAQSRGGLSAAAAFLERAAILTPEPAQRARRLFAAAAAKHDAGARNQALELVAAALTGPLSAGERAKAEQLWDQLRTATSLMDEVRRAVEAGGNTDEVCIESVLEAWRGVEPTTTDDYAKAVLYNGIGRHDAARDAALRALHTPLVITELAEAAARTGHFDLVKALPDPVGDWASGIQARIDALLTEGAQAEAHYRDSITYLDRTHVRIELARAHLLYGEWLRREHRRIDARAQLRTALEMFTSMGAEAFATRAQRELRATGETARKRTQPNHNTLTAQETQVAQLARDGLSNPEIGTRLFISPRTVQYHLRKVFAKLDITSRTQLDRVMLG